MLRPNAEPRIPRSPSKPRQDAGGVSSRGSAVGRSELAATGVSARCQDGRRDATLTGAPVPVRLRAGTNAANGSAGTPSRRHRSGVPLELQPQRAGPFAEERRG